MNLSELSLAQSARIVAVGGDGALRQHLLDMGVIPGVRVTLVKHAPMGDPIEVRIHGYELTMRKADAAKITIDTDLKRSAPEEDPDEKAYVANTQEIPHPGLGEGGRYHEEQSALLPSKPQAAAPGSPVHLALVGNQNCGKTTLFNTLTGSNQHVGNFPGVTVERKDGTIKGHPEVTITDLPGIYSLSPYTNEEVVSRRFVLEQKPDAIINIIDTTCIERSLYLTMQLMELGRPMVLALNFIDELESQGGAVRVNELEHLLGIPVVPIRAVDGEGVDELIDHVLHVARYQEGPARQDFCPSSGIHSAVHRSLHAIMHLVEDHAERAGIPLRFAANKLIEGDTLTRDALDLSQNERETVEHLLAQMEEERGLDRQAAMADMRYAFILNVTARTVVHPKESREHRRSHRIDNILTGRWTALPAFIGIMALVFWFTFNSVGAWLQELFEEGIDASTAWIDDLLSSWDIAPTVHSLVTDGILAGVGSVLSFLPVIVCLFFCLSMLEDSGYMARIAFVMDRPLRRLGLSGRSIVPLLMGFGCSVPSIMASRTLPSERDRKMTILLTPFMSCTAKIPIYAFFVAAFFPGNGAWVMTSMYLIGILTGILVAIVLKHTAFRGEAVPFVMELPNYRMPVARNVGHLLWDKAKDFLERAFTVIFLASIVIWVFQTFDFHLDTVTSNHDSMLAQIAAPVAVLFEPLGLGDWRIVTALICGFLAKESVVSTLGGLFTPETLQATLTATTCYTLMVFCLLYTPCVAAIATVRRELGSRWALIIVITQCLVAWLVAWLVSMML